MMTLNLLKRNKRNKKYDSQKRLNIILIIFITTMEIDFIWGQQIPECPPSEVMPNCPCYSFEDALFLECAGANGDTLKKAMQAVLNEAGPSTIVQSLSVYELDKNIVEFKEGSFPHGSNIRNLQISHSNLKDINENAFLNLRQSIESLGIIESRLTQVPQKALAGLHNLIGLDLESNLIQDLPSYCFWGLNLIKLSLKSNQINTISEHTFAGLEKNLAELDIAENKIKLFPMTALRRLDNLITLKLAWNEISNLPNDGYSIINGLLTLDLSSNNFNELQNDCFKSCPTLKTLSLYYNSIDSVNKYAFLSLNKLESIDLSHNKIVFLDIETFKNNINLRTIELSHNNIHYIGGVFTKLSNLRELYLAENNILEIPSDAFLGSINIEVIYLQQNSIRRIDNRGLASLDKLTQLHLSNNFIDNIPIDFFGYSPNLTSVSLDTNNIKQIEKGTFKSLKQLHELRLNDNKLTIIKNGIFYELPELVELLLHNNFIENIEVGSLATLSGLQHVNLQGNQIKYFNDVFKLTPPTTTTATGTLSSSSLSSTNSSIFGSSLMSIRLDNNGLLKLENNSLHGQVSLRIIRLGNNKLKFLQSELFRDLLLVERLYLTNNTISKIDDSAFKTMQSLKYLDISKNKLANIGNKIFDDLNELEELYLQDNGLRNIEGYSFSSLKKLRILDLSNNNIMILRENIFLNDIPIKKLNLKNSTIMAIELNAFSGLKLLSELNIENNKLTITSLGHINVPSLRTLVASNNNFSNINENCFNELASLQEVILDNVQLAWLANSTFSKNTNLTRIHMKNNYLKNLPINIFNGLINLRELNINNNELIDIPYDSLDDVSNIEILSLSNNNIKNINIGRMSKLIYLREIDFSYNEIETITDFTMTNLSRLLSIDLSNNKLNNLPVNFFLHSYMLRRVDISVNKFHEIPSYALSGDNLSGLTWLNLTKNPLIKIHDKPTELIYPLLLELHISSTNLTIITSQEFQSFPALQHLYLQKNCIQRISPGGFSSLINLLTLNLGQNSLEIMPQERLQGLEHLRILNITNNRIKELDEFPPDLRSLQILDLSYNQISTVGKDTFCNLVSLVELHLYGNWISAISSEAFKPLKKLRLLDLSRNYLENLPLNAFRPLETQIRSLRAEENPLHCDCESQELWEWLRDHQKLVGRLDRERKNYQNDIENVGDNVESGLLRCQQPPELRGLVFLDLDPHTFCSTPLVIKLAIQDIQPFSVFVSWQSRNHSGLYGYQVAYHSLDNVNEVRGKLLDPKARSVKLSKLSSDTRYVICVLGLGSWSAPISQDINTWQWNTTQDDLIDNTVLPIMIDSPMSRCTQVKTLDSPNSIIGNSIISSDNVSLSSILTRRLGLIVGSCMGFVVFILLVTVLGYMKMKKQRAAMKREQPIPTNPPDFMTYRHYSLQSGDRLDTSCPSYITNIGTTTLNS